MTEHEHYYCEFEEDDELEGNMRLMCDCGAFIGEAAIVRRVNEYEEMRDRLLWLDCLEQAGVDNWQGTDLATDFYNELISNGG